MIEVFNHSQLAEISSLKLVFAFDRCLSLSQFQVIIRRWYFHWWLPFFKRFVKVNKNNDNFFLLKTQRTLSSYFIIGYKSRAITLIIWRHRLCLWFIDLHFYSLGKNTILRSQIRTSVRRGSFIPALVFDLSAIYIFVCNDVTTFPSHSVRKFREDIRARSDTPRHYRIAAWSMIKNTARWKLLYPYFMTDSEN